MKRTRRSILTAAPLILAAASFAGAAGGRIEPGDIAYIGAFRLPDGPDEIGWGWSGQAMAYCPAGDPGGPDDGHPGSLFGVGHDWNQYVSEIAIPKPVVSKQKNRADLPTAKTLQQFANIRGDLYGEMEQPRAGLAWLPKQGGQKTAKLYFCWAPHLDEVGTAPSHGWCETDLSNPKPAGPWSVAGLRNYFTCDYLFTIPEAWAGKHVPGMRLATGRYRDGGQAGQGPALYAFGPWNHGTPPPKSATLKAVTLLQYSAVTDEKQETMTGYHHSDEWSGGAWMTAGDTSAVAFVGTKGLGKCWYGYGNGLVWPQEAPFPDVPTGLPNNQRGWWSSKFVARIILYDPADLAAVAAGKMKPSQPQPYASLDIGEVLYGEKSTQLGRHVGAASFDHARGVLYVFEFRGDDDKCLVHAWRVRGT